MNVIYRNRHDQISVILRRKSINTSGAGVHKTKGVRGLSKSVQL
jgi:hypothetical protein